MSRPATKSQSFSLEPAQVQVLTLRLTSTMTLMTAQSLTQCLIPLSLVERGAGNTSCDVSLLSYIQRAWNGVWHVINATSFSHSVLSDSATPRTVARQASLSFTLFQSLLRLISIELMMSSSHLVLCFPLLLSSIFPSIRVFCNE